MDNIKFFRVLWRVNAIIILAWSILLLILISAGFFYDKIASQTRSVYLDDGNVPEEESDRKERWYLGEFTKINHSGQFIVPLKFEQSFSISFVKTKKDRSHS
ncbi:hypothetical protein BGP_5262 [Beggiatoa sp. PS]|nr:hypothetical protein BGP_5262 [Beggiatoa sp. PS]